MVSSRTPRSVGEQLFGVDVCECLYIGEVCCAMARGRPGIVRGVWVAIFSMELFRGLVFIILAGVCSGSRLHKAEQTEC